MTDKMSKEEAKKEFNRWFNPDDFPNRHLVVYEVSQLIDAIEPEHKKVVLPKAVGEQWYKLVAGVGNSVDRALFSLVNGSYDSFRFPLLFYWLWLTPEPYQKLIAAARYGWVPEKEKLDKEKRWNVFVPAAIKVPGHVSLYAKFKYGVQPVNTDGPINSGEFSFTQEELFNYGFNSPLYEKQVVKYGK